MIRRELDNGSLSRPASDFADCSLSDPQQVRGSDQNLAAAHSGADRDQVPKLYAEIHVNRISFASAQRGTSSTDVSGDAPDFSYRDEFEFLIATDGGQSFQVQFRIARYAGEQNAGAVAAGHQRFENLLGWKADGVGHMRRAEILAD